MIDIWVAGGLRLGGRLRDAGEFVDVFTAETEKLLAWCGQGGVADGKTLTSMLWLQNVLAGTWALDWNGAVLAEQPAGQFSP